MDGMTGFLTKADGVRDREAERFAVSVPVRLKPEGVRVITVALRDISTTGLMARTSQSIPLGGYVDIELPAVGDVQARVRWTVGERVGVRFAHPIDVDACRSAMMRLAEAA